jgi:hypothetical protein
MRAGRGVAFLVVVTAVWLAGFGSAFAGPSTGPSPSGTAVSYAASLVGVAGYFHTDREGDWYIDRRAERE